MKPKHLITIIGPTAIGKTALSIQLATYYNTEIISCDSRQFYKEMTIGTAVPSETELKQAQHHFIHHISIFKEYNVGMFERDAIEKIDALFKKNDILIMVGGSGLYADAVLNGLDNFPDVDPNIRLALKSDLKIKGIDDLKSQLKKLDLDSYNQIDLNNQQRLIRALEICIGTKRPYSSFLNNKKQLRNFTPVKIGISADRSIIYNRINNRVELMIQKGLLEEAQKLYGYKNLNALQTVGYKELFQYLDGEYSLDFAISEIKKNTRRFAKRQLTWNKKYTDIEWFEHHYELDQISSYIDQKTSKIL